MSQIPPPGNADSSIGSAQNNVLATELQLPAHPSTTDTASTGPESLAENLLRRGVRVFRNELGQPFASLPVAFPSPHHEVWAISKKSRSFTGCLRRLLRERIPQSRLPSELPGVIEQLLELAEESVATVDLANRVTNRNATVMLDLADPTWQVATVRTSGWEIAQADQPNFRRFLHQRPLPIPIRGGSVEELFDIIPVPTQADRHVILAWMIAFFFPNVSRPILVHVGEAGSGKTTRSRLMRSVLDPSTTETLGKITGSNLVRVLHNNAIPCFDNLGKIADEDSDCFCRAVTGTATDQRRLYTDEDSVLTKFRRSIILNGIAMPTTKADFLDRCIVFELSRLKSFNSEDRIVTEFNKAHSRILGAILDVLVGVLGILPQVPSAGAFRMADFARIGRAVCQVRGFTHEDFDQAYTAVQRRQAEASIDNEPLIKAILEIVQPGEKEFFTEKLLEELESTVAGRAAKGRQWPGSARWLTTRLTELVPTLQALGIVMERPPRTSEGRPIRLYRTAQADFPVQISQPLT